MNSDVQNLGLEDAVDNLYLVFSRYPKPEKIDGCPCCIDERDTKSLLHGALQDITEDDIWGYTFSAFFTLGDVPDFKFFLPRILDLLSEHQGNSLPPETTLAKLVYAEFDAWPLDERDAVHDFLIAAFHELLQLPDEEWPYDDGPEVDSWLCGLSRCVQDIRPFLTILEEREFATKRDHFLIAGDLTDTKNDKSGWWFADSREKEPYFDRLEANRTTVLNWIAKYPIPKSPLTHT